MLKQFLHIEKLQLMVLIIAFFAFSFTIVSTNTSNKELQPIITHSTIEELQTNVMSSDSVEYQE